MDNLKIIIVLHDDQPGTEHQTVVLEGVLQVKAGYMTRTKSMLLGAEISEKISPNEAAYVGEIVDVQETTLLSHNF